MDQKEINKLTKKKSGLVIATIITIVLAIIFIAVSIGVNGNIKSYYQLELDGQAVSGEEAYINVVDMYPFAEEEFDDGSYDDYYIVFDDNDSAYLLCIDREIGDQLYHDLYQHIDEPSYYLVVYGTLYDTDSEIEQLAIDGADYYFDWQGSVTIDDYDDVFLRTYLVEGESSDTIILALGIMLGLSSIVLLIALIVSAIVKAVSKKNKDIKEIRKELSNYPYYRQDNTVISENYILYRNKNKISINKLADLLWVYSAPYDSVKYSLICCDRASSKSFGVFDNKEIVDGLIDEILTHNTSLIVGYSKENREEYQNKKKLL